MVRLKICGITNWNDARLATDLGADFLGFNFYPSSPRYVAPERARGIIRKLPRHVGKVGVFVNEPEEAILAIARRTGIGLLQLHGEESPAAALQIGRTFPVIKAFRIGNRFRLAQLARYLGKAEFFLLDGFHSLRHGGTGQLSDWKLARRATRYAPIFLAGGLTAENVAEAIRQVQPFALDVCSGVEAAPGRKDRKRLKNFLGAVERAGARTL